MESQSESLREHIRSGEYFANAQEWYKSKYINPLSQRSFLLILTTIVCILFLGSVISVRHLLPIKTKIQYAINTETNANQSTQIIKAEKISDNPLLSIADIMIRHYVVKRENYDYSDLQKQFVYVHNNSTRLVYNKFFKFMNIDNPNSPIMRYQKAATRITKIISTTYHGNNKGIVKFRAVSKNIAGDILEDTTWQAEIDFESDPPSTNLPDAAKFNFVVTNYSLQLLKTNTSQ
ncbi:MAG: VirB8/TrbF family protein [Rickettsiaceae bacterium]